MSDAPAPHVLVVGGMRFQHRHLHRIGARLTLLTKAGKLDDLEGDLYSRVLGVQDDAPLDEWQALAETIHRLDSFTACGCFHEIYQEKAARLAQHLGLPALSPAAIERTRQKDKMRHALRAAGLDSTPSLVSADPEALAAFATDHGLPLILKPLDGWGSIGVSKIEQLSDIPAALAWMAQSGWQGAVLVERFHEGVEVSVESFSEGGQHALICITQKFKTSHHFIEIGHCLPAVMDEAAVSAIIALIPRMLDCLGVTDGPAHTEVILSRDGPFVIETHARLGGDMIPDLIETVSGVNIGELWARQVAGESVLARVPLLRQPEQFAAIWYVSPHGTGTLVSVAGEEEARAAPGVRQVALTVKVGQQVGEAHDSFSRAAYVIATGASPEEATQRAQHATSLLSFTLTCPPHPW